MMGNEKWILYNNVEYKRSWNKWNKAKGNITECTISIILFAFDMNIIVKTTEVENRGPLIRSAEHQLHIGDFKDNLIMLYSHNHADSCINHNDNTIIMTSDTVF